MYARDLSRRYAIIFVILTSCYTVAIYAETLLLFYDGVYFWAVIKLVLCCFFFIQLFITNPQTACPGILADVGLGPLTEFCVDKKKRRKVLYVNSSPQKRKPYRKGSASPFQLDARKEQDDASLVRSISDVKNGSPRLSPTPMEHRKKQDDALLDWSTVNMKDSSPSLSPELTEHRTPLLPSASPNVPRYRSNRMVTFDAKLGSNSGSESPPTETMVPLKVKELFDKDGDIARAIHWYVLFYIGPQLVGNIARYNALVAKYDMVWVGFGLKSSGVSPSLFWVTSFVGIITFPFYYWMLVLSQKRAQAFERLNRIAMEVEVNIDEEKESLERISDSVLPAVGPTRAITLEMLDGKQEVKEPTSQSLPSKLAGGAWSKRSAFTDLYDRRKLGKAQAKHKIGNIN